MEDERSSPISCLAFEVSLTGVEAGRRAGIRSYLRVETLPVKGAENRQIDILGSLEKFQFVMYGIDMGDEAAALASKDTAVLSR